MEKGSGEFLITMILVRIWFICLVTSILVGCGSGPPPRMIDLLGEDAFAHGERPFQNNEWRQQSRIGLVVYSDATGQNAAPAIISEYLEILTRRTEKFLKQQCVFHEIVVVPPLSNPVNLAQELKVQGQRLHVPYEIVVVFSSQEQAGPEKIGQATMMTLMSGTVVENLSLAEVGILHVSDFHLVFRTVGRGTDSLEQLDVPIGSNRPTPIDARDILRAQAAQHALDRALASLGSACQIEKKARTGFTDSFRIANRVRNPALSDAS
ncbi:MAG TPA: hypothetical protein PKM72_06820 [Nitrospirales bacterium]|nr:hypothetical protein [Nitrospirales bacterium]